MGREKGEVEEGREKGQEGREKGTRGKGNGDGKLKNTHTKSSIRNA